VTVLEVVPEAIAPLQRLYGRADGDFDEMSRRFSPDELDVVARSLDAVSDFCTSGAMPGRRGV
jgi:seryl-tRNA(Sec) selenium transferase